MDDKNTGRNEMCSCGHFGGSSIPSLQNHEPNFQAGHGKCTVEECNCNWFTWVGFCDDKGVEVPIPSGMIKNG